VDTKDLMKKYNFEKINGHIKTIEKAAREIKNLSGGMKAVDVNTDSILAFTYILHQNVSHVVDLESEEVNL